MKFLKYLVVLLAAVSLLAAPQSKKSTPKSDAGKTGSAASASTAKLIDINTASEDELKALPGIGDAYSKKIVQNRPYRAKNQLVQKKIIPQATYDKIKDRIVAKQNGGK
jgi:competence protein ComEA